ncbi:MAG: flagellar hook-length control protein FliK [Planctomycetaceae bacterium]|nr:flagellar hook-length control protein FliK [Planctomycetaceae bacterium]
MDQPALNNVFPLVTPVQRGPSAPSPRGRQPGESSDDTRFRDALGQQRSNTAPPKRREQPPSDSKSASKSGPASSPPSSSTPSQPTSSSGANEQDDASVAESTIIVPTIEVEVSSETSPSSEQDVGDESVGILAPIEQSLVALSAAVPEIPQVDVTDQPANPSERATESIPAPRGLTESLHASLPKETALHTLARVVNGNDETSDVPPSAPPGLVQAISAVSKVQTDNRPARETPVVIPEPLLATVPITGGEDAAAVVPAETLVAPSQPIEIGDNAPVDQPNSTIVDEIPAEVASEPSANRAPVAGDLPDDADQTAPQMNPLQSTRHPAAIPNATETRRDQPSDELAIDEIVPLAPVANDTGAADSSNENSSAGDTQEIDTPRAEVYAGTRHDDQDARERPEANERRDFVPPAMPDSRRDRSERRAEQRSRQESAVTPAQAVVDPGQFATRGMDRIANQSIEITTTSNNSVATEPTVPATSEPLPSTDLQNPEFLQSLDAISTSRIVNASGDVADAAMPPAIRKIQSSWPQPIVGNEELVFDLTPPELGRIRIELRHGEAGLVARFETETPAARQLITEHLPALRESLQQQGAVMERVEVRGRDDAAAFGQHSQSFGEQARDQRQQPENSYITEPAADEPPSQQPRAEAATPRRRDGSALNIRV